MIRKNIVVSRLWLLGRRRFWLSYSSPSHSNSSSYIYIFRYNCSIFKSTIRSVTQPKSLQPRKHQTYHHYVGRTFWTASSILCCSRSLLILKSTRPAATSSIFFVPSSGSWRSQSQKWHPSHLTAKHGRRDSVSSYKLGPTIRPRNTPPILRWHIYLSTTVNMAPSIRWWHLHVKLVRGRTATHRRITRGSFQSWYRGRK